ncbi:MAG: PAS domain-containing protein [Deltaproteobacteria bacterium]|nr:PAS domain-containing protein [Deltaproteobacteria bacterium]
MRLGLRCKLTFASFLAAVLVVGLGWLCLKLARPLWLLLVLLASLAATFALVWSMILSRLVSRELRQLVDGIRRSAFEGSSTESVVREPAIPLRHLSEELERMVAALSAERDRFEVVLSGMESAVLLLDDACRIELVNPAAGRMLGLPGELESRVLADVLRGSESPPELAELEQLVSSALGGQSKTAEFDLTASGAFPARRVVARATPELHGSGVVLVIDDVTELRRLETIRRDFIANVSHELRTPVSIIRANAETLLDGALHSEQATTFVEALARHAERLSNLVSDLLEISRIESGHALELEELLLLPAIQRAIDAFAAPAEKKRLSLHTQMEDPLRVLASDNALDQILFNLLDNAVKYTPEGGRIEVRARREGGGRVRIEVCDNGTGIAPEHRSRIFERFYRVDKGRSRAMGGTGLGLSIVKHQVDRMQGSVGVEPNRPAGSVFWVSLPEAG